MATAAVVGPPGATANGLPQLAVNSFTVTGGAVNFNIVNNGPGTAPVTMHIVLPSGWAFNDTLPPGCTNTPANDLNCVLGTAPVDDPLVQSKNFTPGADGTATIDIFCPGSVCYAAHAEFVIGTPPTTAPPTTAPPSTPPPTPEPPAASPSCPTAPVLVTEENKVGAGIAWYVCRMQLVGGVWDGAVRLILLPEGFFPCPAPPEAVWATPGFEFGGFLLQAKCGYRPWITRWFGFIRGVYLPPR